MDAQRTGPHGPNVVSLALAASFAGAIEWVAARGSALLDTAERAAARTFAAESADPAALGRGMTAYAAGIVAGARLRGREVRAGDDDALREAVGEAGRRGTHRVVAAHCDPVAVAAAETSCAATLSRGVADPHGRVSAALHLLFEQGLAVGLTLAET